MIRLSVAAKKQVLDGRVDGALQGACELYRQQCSRVWEFFDLRQRSKEDSELLLCALALTIPAWLLTSKAWGERLCSKLDCGALDESARRRVLVFFRLPQALEDRLQEYRKREGYALDAGALAEAGRLGRVLVRFFSDDFARQLHRRPLPFSVYGVATEFICDWRSHLAGLARRVFRSAYTGETDVARKHRGRPVFFEPLAEPPDDAQLSPEQVLIGKEEARSLDLPALGVRPKDAVFLGEYMRALADGNRLHGRKGDSFRRLWPGDQYERNCKRLQRMRRRYPELIRRVEERLGQGR
jgi:hypothetical protein